jgi:hypothetical protein
MAKKDERAATRRAKDQRRIPLSMRITPEIRERLVAEAEARGRSITQEAELRLEASFDEQRHLLRALAAIFGDRPAGLLLEIGLVLDELARHRPFGADPFTPQPDWIEDPFLYDQAIKAVVRLLERGRPPGETEPPKTDYAVNPAFGPQPDLERHLAMLAQIDRAPGRAAADGVLSQLPQSLAHIHRVARDLLGPDFMKRLERRPSDGTGPSAVHIRNNQMPPE